MNNSENSDQNNDFDFFLEQFSDVKIMRYLVPGFEDLSIQQKRLVYYLSEAALCGRDIIFDQNYKYNLKIRKTLEEIYKKYTGNRKTTEFAKFIEYLKKVWFSNGIHHHYSTDKFVPGFSEEYFLELISMSQNCRLPFSNGQSRDEFLSEIVSVIFDPVVAPKRVSLDDSKDLIEHSACNFYENISQDEAEAFYNKLKDPNDKTPVSFGLNSKLVKEDNNIKEETYKVNGLYSKALENTVYWLNKAMEVAENKQQKDVILKLVDFYNSGDLKEYDDYNILWVNDLESEVDFVNGFTEVYGDPLGMKATWESIVNFKNIEATKRAEIISGNAQWFEDNSPVDERFKKPEVKGVSAKVITIAQLGGECYPSTPIGINLPNADWIRKEHGSKSVTIENITYAYDQVSQGSGFLEEFCYFKDEIELSKKYGSFAGNLHTDLHECLGHGSGQLLTGVSSEALKNYSSSLEEARADLFALYYMMHPKMIELGIMPSQDVAKTEYNGYIRNGLMTQLTRIDLGKNVEQAHMRNRQLIARWCFEMGKEKNVIEELIRDKKTYYKVNDYSELQRLFGVLLAEVQRIKSEGDFEAGKELIENYGINIDDKLHREVKERFARLNIAPYGGFVNPVLSEVIEGDEIIDIRIDYSEGYSEQMLRYSEKYSFLDAG